jgi:hypothetical protein
VVILLWFECVEGELREAMVCSFASIVPPAGHGDVGASRVCG